MKITVETIVKAPIEKVWAALLSGGMPHPLIGTRPRPL
jgi:hypothetical protein